MALWLFATVEGIGSAREIERRTLATTRFVGFVVVCRSITIGYRDSERDQRSYWTMC